MDSIVGCMASDLAVCDSILLNFDPGPDSDYDEIYLLRLDASLELIWHGTSAVWEGTESVGSENSVREFAGGPKLKIGVAKVPVSALDSL